MIILQLPGGVYSVYRKEVVNPNCISNASFQSETKFPISDFSQNGAHVSDNGL